MTASVILPTFREKDSIPPMLRALDALNLPGLEIIVADDHSPDGTEAAALETAKTLHTPVRVEQNPGVRGLAPSVVHGLMCSDGAAFAARLLLGITLKDPMSGFFAIRRSAFDRVKTCLSPEGFKIMLELAFLLSLTGRDKVLEHPITFAMRKHGESKLSGRVIVQYLSMLMRFVRAKGSLRRRLAAQS